MPSGRAVPRSIRLTQIQYHLHRKPAGLTTNELAQLCGVSCRTIQRDLLDLDTELHVPITHDGDRYGLMGGYTLPPITFSLYEALALFLAGRLVLRQIDHNNPHVQQALVKMAAALPPELARQLTTGIQAIARKPGKPEFVHIFEQIAVAWVAQRQLRIRYCSLRSGDVKEWLLEPYFVETTGVGYSTYVIGHGKRRGKDGIVTFKLDRIISAELLDRNYDIPPDCDVAKLLIGSWGVIWGDEVDLKLRFAPGVARRVKESTWHPSQRLEDLPDGGCILSLRTNALELTPWIRSWGPDVEVLEPETVRNEFRTWAGRLYEMYESIAKAVNKSK